MTIHYDKKDNVLTITLGPEAYDSYAYETGDFTVALNDQDSIVSIRLANADKFIRRALAAGVEIEGVPKIEPPKAEMVWYDADSSMISAFGYDEVNGVLDVAFHRTGVYRYFDVPLHVFEGLRDASSKGSYMRDLIIDMFPYEKKRGRSR